MRRGISSLRLTSVLLGLIAATAVLGTVIAQNEPAGFYALRYGHWLGQFILLMGIDRWYTSIAFVSLECLLGINLAACLIRSGRIHLAAGGSKRLLVVFHAGLLMLYIGAGLSAWLRQEKFYQLLPGQRLVFPQAATSVEVKSFDIVFYPGTDQPREFCTAAVVHAAARPAQERSIRVNHPLAIGAHTVYQSSFEVAGKARLQVRQADVLLWQGWITLGEEVALSGATGLTLKLEAFMPDAMLTLQSGVQSRSHRLRNPGVLIGVYENGAPVERYWWSADGIMAHATPRFTVSVEQTDLVYATILKTVNDPGFPLVGAGFFLVCIAGAGYVWRRERETAPLITQRGNECSD